MTECQSAYGSRLPPEATGDQIQKVRQACEWDKIRLGSTAQFYVNYARISSHVLRVAVLRHITEGRKIFRKHKPNEPQTLLENNLQATVTMYEGKDIYVEMILTKGVIVILNAHEHTTLLRLPQ